MHKMGGNEKRWPRFGLRGESCSPVLPRFCPFIVLRIQLTNVRHSLVYLIPSRAAYEFSRREIAFPEFILNRIRIAEPSVMLRVKNVEVTNLSYYLQFFEFFDAGVE
jgi:hypothetical protein